MVVLSPLLDLAGFYAKPYHIEAETSVELALEQRGGEIIRGRIDVLVLNQQLWLLVIESKRNLSNKKTAIFDVMTAVPQALTDMLGNPDATQPSYGLVTNGHLFLIPQSRAAAHPAVQLLTPVLADQPRQRALCGTSNSEAAREPDLAWVAIAPNAPPFAV